MTHVTPLDPPGPHCRNRLLEWTMALAMAAFGVHVLLLPSTFVTSRYASVLLLLTPLQFAAACIVVGIGRIAALSQNGKWSVYGSMIRSLLALAAAAIWGQLAVALSLSSIGAPSPGMWVYLALMGAELRSVWRARRDANGP